MVSNQGTVMNGDLEDVGEGGRIQPGSCPPPRAALGVGLPVISVNGVGSKVQRLREGSGEGLGPCAVDGTLGVPLPGRSSRKGKPEGILGATG